MTKESIPFYWGGHGATLTFTDTRPNGKQYTMQANQHNIEEVKNAIKDGDIEKAITLVSYAARMENFGRGHISINNGKFMYRGEELDSSITKVIKKMVAQGEDVDPLINFLNKLMDNPSQRSREQLYGFIDKHLFAITPKGDFLAYKVVTSDYKDCYTKSFDNSIGATVKISREAVDDDPNRTCSNGLHVCGKSYIGSFKSFDNIVVLCEVNPVDVVSIPTDYNHAKMRVCQYKVVQQVSEQYEDDETAVIVDVGAGKAYRRHKGVVQIIGKGKDAISKLLRW